MVIKEWANHPLHILKKRRKKMLVGGYNRLDLFRIKVVSNAYVAYQLDGTTAATSAAHKIISLNKTVQTQVQVQENGNLNITLDQDVDNEAFNTMIETLVTGVEASTDIVVGERIYENGTKAYGENGNPNADNLVLAIVYGAKTADDKLKMTMAIGTINATSGSFTQSATETSKPVFIFNGIKAGYAYDAVDLLDTAVLTAPADFEILANKGLKIQFIAIAE